MIPKTENRKQSKKAIKRKSITKKENSQRKPRFQESVVGGDKRKKYGPREDSYTTPVWSVLYKDNTISLSENRLTAIGHKGWASVLLSHATDFGCWYFEAVIEKHFFDGEKTDQRGLSFVGWPHVSPPPPAIRIGWSTRFSRFGMSIGSDIFGFCICDKDGTIISNAKKHQYAKRVLKPGDVVGCGIVLVSPPPYIQWDPSAKPELYSFLQAGLLCDPEHPPNPVQRVGCFTEFVLNGEVFGPADVGIFGGAYHPAVSLYMGASCRLNLGNLFYQRVLTEFVLVELLLKQDQISYTTPLKFLKSCRNSWD